MTGRRDLPGRDPYIHEPLEVLIPLPMHVDDLRMLLDGLGGTLDGCLVTGTRFLDYRTGEKTLVVEVRGHPGPPDDEQAAG